MTQANSGTMTALQYAALLVKSCRDRLDKNPYEMPISAATWEQFLEMIAEAPVPSQALEFVNVLACEVESMLGRTSVVQDPVLCQLLVIRQALKVSSGEPKATYRHDGRYQEYTDHRGVPQEQPKSDRFTRLGDAVGACLRCFLQVTACRQHIFFVEDAAGKGAEHPLSWPLIKGMEMDLWGILTLLSMNSPDFKQVIRTSEAIRNDFTLLEMLDPVWFESQWSLRSDLVVVTENLELAQENPTGTRVY
jgi:hypothetical protein